MNLDQSLFNLIFGLSGRQKWLDFLAIFFARYLAYLMVICLVAIAFVLGNISMLFLPVAVGLFSRFIVNEIIYFFYKRKRPSEVLQLNTLIKSPKHPAFPSGHASFFFAFSFAVLPFSVALGVIFIVSSCLMGFFRVLAGVHWPSDILSGVFVAGVSWILFNL